MGINTACQLLASFPYELSSVHTERGRDVMLSQVALPLPRRMSHNVTQNGNSIVGMESVAFRDRDTHSSPCDSPIPGTAPPPAAAFPELTGTLP